MTKGKATLVTKYLHKEPSQQLQIDNVSTNAVENTNGTDQGKDL